MISAIVLSVMYVSMYLCIYVYIYIYILFTFFFQLLRKNPDDRLPLKDVLEHKWIRENSSMFKKGSNHFAPQAPKE